MLDNEKAARQKRLVHGLMWVILLVMFISFIFPFVLVVINVFKTKGDITKDPLALIGEHGFTLQNFPEAMEKMMEMEVETELCIVCFTHAETG